MSPSTDEGSLAACIMQIPPPIEFPASTTGPPATSSMKWDSRARFAVCLLLRRGALGSAGGGPALEYGPSPRVLHGEGLYRPARLQVRCVNRPGGAVFFV